MTLLVVAAVGVLAALAVADALRSGRSSSMADTTTEPAPTTTGPAQRLSTDELDPPEKSCGSFRIAPPGEYPLLLVEVVAGDVSCHVARRVMKAHYTSGATGSWRCHGPEGDAGCEKPTGDTIGARFGARFGPSLSEDREIERIGNRWARVFAAGSPSCFHMTQPLCQRIDCERVGGVQIRHCTPPTLAYRRSFEGATVEEIAIKGVRVAARFSNGEAVEVFGDGGTWWIQKVGGNAGQGFFE